MEKQPKLEAGHANGKCKSDKAVKSELAFFDLRIRSAQQDEYHPIGRIKVKH